MRLIFVGLFGNLAKQKNSQLPRNWGRDFGMLRNSADLEYSKTDCFRMVPLTEALIQWRNENQLARRTAADSTRLRQRGATTLAAFYWSL